VQRSSFNDRFSEEFGESAWITPDIFILSRIDRDSLSLSLSLSLSGKSLRAEKQASNTKNRFSHWISSLAESSIHLGEDSRTTRGEEGVGREEG